MMNSAVDFDDIILYFTESISSRQGEVKTLPVKQLPGPALGISSAKADTVQYFPDLLVYRNPLPLHQ